MAVLRVVIPMVLCLLFAKHGFYGMPLMCIATLLLSWEGPTSAPGSLGGAAGEQADGDRRFC